MSASTSVFARFKRHNTSAVAESGSGSGNNAGNSNRSSPVKVLGEGRSAIDASGGAVEWKGGQLIQHGQITKTQHAHRRDSSILSLTTSVTDSAKGFGANVKRSVSLRSHRTNNSTSGSSFGASNNTKSPNSATQHLTPLSSASPVEHSDEEGDRPTLPPATAPAHPLLKRKISLTAKGLSRFKSTEALPSLNSPAYLQSVGAIPTPALQRSDSMLVSSQPSHAPLSRKTSDQNRPGLQSQTSFTRDISSSHSTSAPLQHVPSIPQGITGGPLNPNTIYAQIQETSAKRIATIDYMRKLHEGDIFYFGTMHYSQSALHSMPSMQAHKLGRRATNYFLLGYSLPALLDLNAANPLEYLRALSALLTEFETYQSLCGFDASGNIVKNSRMGGILKSGLRSTKGRRSSTAITPSDLSLDTRQAELLGIPSKDSNPQSPQDMSSPINPTGHEFSYLLTPHIPFEPDFSTTLGTLCDTLIDTYTRLMDLVAGPDQCSPIVGEAFGKADKAIRKILVANVVREFEDTTRVVMKGELAGLGKLTLGGLM
ncbi:hypothetical protein Slin15195_G118650 [Septoria linicola]|uniref:Uncharacterized protein n=1 Tax=Septoria linicola TaxID=215465 RepID=A0A9Q9EP88_9PEZI|nr:hypothetical protein Slin14017_G095640 [Septoria linicola]USW58546.1 hypothetical protein Slin15195_G118650 [Septoria linicola]